MNRSIVHQASVVTRTVVARLRFVVVFLIAAGVIGYWDDIKNHVDKWTRPHSEVAHTHDAEEVEYFCSMHPNIIRSEPGNCPICGMPLIKRIKSAVPSTMPADLLARVQLSPQRIALAGIQTVPVERRALVREIQALGVLDYDETKIARLSAWVTGRADKLFVQYVGQAVQKGNPVYSLYSPEVFTALREYLTARQRVNALPKDAAEDTRSDAAAVYNASLQKLVLWGISREQLDEIDHAFDQTRSVPNDLVITSPIGGIVVAKEIYQGGYVNVGDKPYTIADLSSLWLQLKVYERDVPLVNVGQAVDVTVESVPDKVFHGTVTFKAFQLDPQTRTLDARVEVSNPDLELRPGMFGDALIRVPVGDVEFHRSSTTKPAVASVQSEAFAAALAPYLKAQSLLARDQLADVPTLLLESAEKAAALGKPAERLTSLAHSATGQDIQTLRKTTFKDFSQTMIERGRATGLPTDSAPVQVFRCPMAKADWLQTGSTIANPFYGSEMLECGAAIETLPKAVIATAAPASHPTTQAATVLAIPRSAVIETGRSHIVYVESSSGVYDMRAVRLGPTAGEFYPVMSGLAEGDKVVTSGAFLIDSENRLNP